MFFNEKTPDRCCCNCRTRRRSAFTTQAELQDIPLQLLHALVGALPVVLICLIPVTYLTVSWMFTLPLIADRGLKFWPAMRTSFKMVNRHWWQVFGLFVLTSLITVAGLLACCIGILSPGAHRHRGVDVRL